MASGTYLPLDSDNECRPPGTRGGTRNEEREQACASAYVDDQQLGEISGDGDGGGGGGDGD